MSSGKAGVPTFYEPRPVRTLTGSERAAIELLRDHERLDAEIAAQAGCDVADVAYARRLLEKVPIAGIRRWRPGRSTSRQQTRLALPRR